MTLSMAAKICGGKNFGGDGTFTGVSIDTRTLQKGDLYVAIKGEKYDGHDFVSQAADAGARGALVERPVQAKLPLLRVSHTRSALGNLARYWREQFDVPVIAVTGSNGKTTVKEMLAAILAKVGAGCISRGNLNNDIGLPLSLLRLKEGDRYMVCEMGMNHLHEIKYLSSLTRPDVAVITNAGRAHLEGVGSIEQVAHAKGEILSGLAEDGTAVLNADDPFFAYWQGIVPSGRIKSFALDNSADVSATYKVDGRGVNMQINAEGASINVALRLLGRHNVMNSLAATTAALVLGVDPKKIEAGLTAMQPVKGRLEIKSGLKGACIIDDTYNANPDSLQAAMEVLKTFPGKHVLVLGDMAELGANARLLHEQVGDQARIFGIESLYALGKVSAVAAAKFGKDGRHYYERNALIEALLAEINSDTTVLIKGSRMMKMEEIVDAITVHHNDANQGRH